MIHWQKLFLTIHWQKLFLTIQRQTQFKRPCIWKEM